MCKRALFLFLYSCIFAEILVGRLCKYEKQQVQQAWNYWGIKGVSMKNEVLYRHILTGVLILLLPVIVLTGFIQTKILGQIKDSYIYQLENQVIQ